MWTKLFVTGWLLACSIMDVRTRRVPVWMLALGGVLCTLSAVIQGNGSLDALRGMLPGILLLLIAFATKKAGYGDGIALSCLGLVLGGSGCLLLFSISLFLTSLCAMALLAVHKVRRDTSMPFLPFLGAAWIIVLLLPAS